MSDPLEGQDDAATPLTEEELADLIPSYIALRSELNDAEQVNIVEAEEWAFARKREETISSTAYQGLGFSQNR